MSKKILVIEDNSEVRDNIVEILTLDGYDVLSAENGKIGVEAARAQLPDLIICDIMMPVLDGYGVLKILNRNADTHHIPFIFLTAKSEKSDFRKGMGLGADDYITKPFEDTELLEAVDMRLKKSLNLHEIVRKPDADLRTFFSEAKAREGLESLSEDREVRHFQAKQMIYQEGAIPKWLFYIISGKVKCYKSNDYGKELITHMYSEGDFFGHLPLLQKEPYEENAMAMEECKVKLIPEKDFRLLLFNDKDFSAQFIKMIANETTEVEQQLLDLAYGSVRKKVANALLTALKHDPDDKDIISVSRDDLSKLAGVAKETLIRTLSDFKSEDLIKVDGNTIKLLDKPALSNMPQ
ncbi:MAG: response regulator [Saprospiraceae bacterium]|nr:response regulator [Saprospiraceae bacterium]